MLGPSLPRRTLQALFVLAHPSNYPCPSRPCLFGPPRRAYLVVFCVLCIIESMPGSVKLQITSCYNYGMLSQRAFCGSELWLRHSRATLSPGLAPEEIAHMQSRARCA